VLNLDIEQFEDRIAMDIPSGLRGYGPLRASIVPGEDQEDV
jgi:hypothetical protein